MSWQGNECFVFVIEYEDHDRDEWHRMEALESLLDLYEEHGSGWYLTGYLEPCGDEGDYDPFVLRGDWGYGLMPNPFMGPNVDAFWVGRAHDLISVAFECWDSSCDTVAYAGDGKEPLEHIAVYGIGHDMRKDARPAA